MKGKSKDCGKDGAASSCKRCGKFWCARIAGREAIAQTSAGPRIHSHRAPQPSLASASRTEASVSGAARLGTWRPVVRTRRNPLLPWVTARLQCRSRRVVDHVVLRSPRKEEQERLWRQGQGSRQLLELKPTGSTIPMRCRKR